MASPRGRGQTAPVSRSSGLVTVTDGLFITCTYTIVVFKLACPSSVCTCRTSYPLSSRCVAMLWRNAWQVTRLATPAARGAAPHLVTAPEHEAVLRELMEREPLFHGQVFGATRNDFEKMTAAEFWELGASGRRFSRQFVLDALERRY